LAKNNIFQFFAGLAAGRTGQTPAQGEPLWVTDDKLLYVGDAATAGGVRVSTYGWDWKAGTEPGFHSLGFDDNATELTALISNAVLSLQKTGLNQTFTIKTSQTDQVLDIWSGSDNAGGRILLKGSTSPEAKDILFASNNAQVALYDFSALQWNFDGPFDIDGDLTCAAFTSTGIDDNATSEKMQLADVQLSLGSGATFSIAHGSTNQTMVYSGGSTSNLGSNLVCYGEAHATAGDFLFRSSVSNELHFDASNSWWNFQDNYMRNARNGTGVTLLLLQSDLGVNTRNMQILAPETDSVSGPFIFSTANSFQFRVDATNALRIDDSGNVGVGLIAPAGHQLNVLSASEAKATFIQRNSAQGITMWGDGTGNFIVSESASSKKLTIVEDSGAGSITFENPRGSERMRINSAGDVGINRTAPDSIFHVRDANPIIIIQDTETGTGNMLSTLRLAESGAASVVDNYFDVALSGSAVSGITNGGFVIESNGTNNILTLDRITGHCGLGGVPHATAHLDVHGGITMAYLMMDTTSGIYRQVANSTLRIGGGSDAFSGGNIRFHGESETNANRVSIFTNTTERVRMGDTANIEIINGDLVLSTAGSGIDFSATSDASGATSELLDDYEEGTWTPLIQDDSLDDQGQSYLEQIGRYVKIGRIVYITCSVQMDSQGSLTSGQITNIAGLPFTSASVSGSEGGVTAHDGVSLAITAAASVTGKVILGSTYIGMTEWNATFGVSTFTIANLSSGGKLKFTGFYEV